MWHNAVFGGKGLDNGGFKEFILLVGGKITIIHHDPHIQIKTNCNSIDKFYIVITTIVH